MRHVHFCAGLQQWNGMANLARMLVKEQTASGDESVLTNSLIDLKRQLERGADEVCIHGAWLPVLWRAAKVTKRVGTRLVLMLHGSYDPVRRRYHGWKKLLVSPFEHSMARRADRIVATCEAEKGWIENYLVKRIPPIEVTDIRRFYNLSRVEHVDRVESGELHLLYLGRRHPLKGVEYLEKAVAELNSNPANPVNPVKNSSLHVSTRSTRLKIISNAFGEELEKVWNWCDVLVLPTISENFGLVIAEALERGKRVITTDGAPAWGDGNTYGGRLTYLRGYRDGTPEYRVELLRTAILALFNK